MKRSKAALACWFVAAVTLPAVATSAGTAPDAAREAHVRLTTLIADQTEHGVDHDHASERPAAITEQGTLHILDTWPAGTHAGDEGVLTYVVDRTGVWAPVGFEPEAHALNARLEGRRTVTVVNVTYQGQAAVPNPDLTTAFREVNDIYSQASGNRLSFTLAGVATLELPSAGTWGCAADMTNLWNTVRSRVQVSSEHLLVVASQPASGSCVSWLGLGAMPGSDMFIWAEAFNSKVLAHELGHNLGLNHAHGASCPVTAAGAVAIDADKLTEQCTEAVTRDPFSVMGSYPGPPPLSGADRDLAGWTDRTVTVTSSGRFEIGPAAANGNVLRIPVGPRTMYVEFRTSGGADSHWPLIRSRYFAPLVAGVQIRYALPPASPSLPASAGGTWLVDARPGQSRHASQEFFDAGFTRGERFTDGNVTVSVVAVASQSATVDITITGSASQTPAQPTVPNTDGRGGWWLLGSDGRVYSFGDAPWYGNGAADAVDIEATPTGDGYVIAHRNGRLIGFGNVPVLPRLPSGVQVAGLALTPNGAGGWVFSTAGLVYPFGNARQFGDLQGVALNGPILDGVATTSGSGYWLVASDGGVFAFGDARFYGSMGGRPLNRPVNGLVPTASGSGYWLVASDGGVFAFGDAPFRGSMGGRPLNQPVVRMVRGAGGYVMVASDGGVFNFSDGPFVGSLGDEPPSAPIVSVAVKGS